MTTQIPADIITPLLPPDSAKYILIVTADKVEDLELMYPYYRLVEEDFRVEIATPSGAVKGKMGYELKETRTVAGLIPDEYDMLVLPGGKAPQELKKNEDVLTLVRLFAAQGKPIAAICHGPLILAAAGVIAGRTLSGYPEIRGEIENAGAAYAGKDMLDDGQFITSRWPADLPVFMRAVIKMLKKKDETLKIEPKPHVGDASSMADADAAAERLQENFQSAS